MFIGCKNSGSSLLPILVVLFVFATPLICPAVEIDEGVRLYSSTLDGLDNYGYAVDIDGITAIVGASGETLEFGDPPVVRTVGAAYLFDWYSGWQQQAVVFPDDYEIFHSSGFGQAVAVDGEYAVVGAPGQDSYGPQTGAAYVYFNNGIEWIQIHKLIGGTPGEGKRFGASLNLDGTSLVVGAPFYSADGPGEVHVYMDISLPGVFGEKLIAGDSVIGDRFGSAVAIHEDKIFVGAPGKDNGHGGHGVVYVFEQTDLGWTETAKLTSSDGDLSVRFGNALDFDGETLIVGDVQGPSPLRAFGAAYIFTNIIGFWAEEAKLLPSQLLYEGFGRSVAIEGGLALVGQDGYHDLLLEPGGFVYQFERSAGQWTEQGYVTGSELAGDSRFGESLALQRGRFVVGDSANDEDGYNSGAAYLFSAKTAEQIDCDGFAAPLDEYPVTIKGRRPTLPLRATLYDDAGNQITDADILDPPVAQVYFDPIEDVDAVDITGDLSPSVIADVGNEFEFTPSGVWQYVLGLDAHSASGMYTVRMESSDTDEYDFNEVCVTQFIVP